MTMLHSLQSVVSSTRKGVNIAETENEADIAAASDEVDREIQSAIQMMSQQIDKQQRPQQHAMTNNVQRDDSSSEGDHAAPSGDGGDGVINWAS